MLTTTAASTAISPHRPSPPLSHSPIHKTPHKYLEPINRRHLLTSFTIFTAPIFAFPYPNSPNPISVPLAGARGLFQMPPFRLNNRRIVPEYSFLDARGLGAFEGKDLEAISEVYASDSVSSRIKPPPTDDGTPNESVMDVFVRVTQLMSILETQYSGETVIVISPDSDNLTILQAGLVGLDLRRHRDLSFSSGEVRLVDPSSIPTYKQPTTSVFKCSNPPSCS